MTTSPFFKTDAAGTTVEVTFGDKTAEKKFGLGYWSIRGLGAPLTMMLCAAKTPFSLYLYDIVEDGESWTSDYFGAKTGYIEDYSQPLWNLPFCVNNAEKKVLTQTNAIFNHVGRACGMLGDDEMSTSQCESLLCEIYDLRNVMVGFAYGSSEDAASILANGMKHLKKIEAVLEIEAKKSTGEVVHLVNGKFSAPDFHLFEMLDQFEAFCKTYELGDLYTDLKRLQQFKEGFAKLDENKPYLESWLHKELPFNNCMARFGSLPGPKTYVHTESSKLAAWRNKGVVELNLD